MTPTDVSMLFTILLILFIMIQGVAVFRLGAGKDGQSNVLLMILSVLGFIFSLVGVINT